MGAIVSVFNKSADPTDSELITTTQITRTSDESTTPNIGLVLGAVAFVVICVFVAAAILPHPGFPPERTASLVEGLTIFAVFFVGAQALERLLEPLALALGIGATEKAKAQETLQSAVEAAANPALDASNAVAEAAKAKAKNIRRVAEKTILFWGIASGLAALASGSFGFYFLSTVGIPVPQLWMEILGTALIIGAGTKPLHDLISLIEKKKDAAAS